MSTPFSYQESIINYFVAIPFVIILLALLIGVISIDGSSGLIIPFVVLAIIFITIFKLKICSKNHKLQLILGIMGLFKKTIQLSDLNLTDFKETHILWYLKGTLFKYDYQGNLIFCPRSEKALILEYKTGKNCILIVSQNK